MLKGLLFIIVIIFGWSSYYELTKPTIEELSHQQELKSTAQKLARTKVDEKMYLYRKALQQGNKGVACKLSREMYYWASQTVDQDLIGNVHQLQYEVCGHG